MARLRAAGCVFAEDEARVLLESTPDRAELDHRLTRREAGEPLEVIVGWAEFCGLRIAVDPGVFVPRQRTALLVSLAVQHLRTGSATRAGGAGRTVVLDLCCGTGAVGLAVAETLARGAGSVRVELVAAEVDLVAVACAERNLTGRGTVYAGDLFAPLPPDLHGRVDVLLANAPYVPTDAIALMPPEARDHEPRTALDGGTDGLAVHRRIAAQAPLWLAPGGVLLIEVSERQVPAAVELFRASGLKARVVRDDDSGAVAVVGRRREAGAPAEDRRPTGPPRAAG